MDFSEALNEMKAGKRASRMIGHITGNDFGSIALMPGYPDGVEPNETTLKTFPDIARLRSPVEVSPYFMRYSLYTPGYVLSNWMPNLEDLLAEDWYMEE